jgi:hypothetical protein
LISYVEKEREKWHLVNYFENDHDAIGYDIWVNTCTNSICTNVHTLSDKTYSQLCSHHNNIKYFKSQDLMNVLPREIPFEVGNIMFQYCNYNILDYAQSHKLSLFSHQEWQSRLMSYG